jgi:voltage-gated potassium channel
MTDQQQHLSRSEKWMDKRLERRGLRPRDAAYVIGAFWALAVVAFGVVERIVDHKTFHTVWLGMWWAVETITTVGYGDVVPNQTAGKAIAAFLMVGGLSLLSVITAAITSGFVSRAQNQQRAAGEDPVMQRLDVLSRQLESVKAELIQMRSATGTGGPEAGTGRPEAGTGGSDAPATGTGGPDAPATGTRGPDGPATDDG